jgi:catechol 2,3-dioxygenase
MYIIPPQTTIGHVHLTVGDLDRALAFYQGLLGFQITARYGTGAVFLSAGGYHHHIGLNTWQGQGVSPAPAGYAGLYHVAILYPTRAALATAVQRLVTAAYPITGFADHGVSEAVYLDDPDGNGVELYVDRPQSEWKYNADGTVAMVTEPLDVADLLTLAEPPVSEV